MTPGTRPDLVSRSEIDELARSFYRDVAQDDLLAPLFSVVADVDWDEHIDNVVRFWSRTRLGVGDFQGNPLAAHQRIHDQAPFGPEHFARWLDLFFDNVDAGWQGCNATKDQENRGKGRKFAQLEAPCAAAHCRSGCGRRR